MASAPKRSKTENDPKTVDPRIPTPPDFNPVYPFPDDSTIIAPITPIPTPAFVSDLDFATDHGGVLTIRTQPPIVNNGLGITLDYDLTDFKVTNNVLQLANKSPSLIFEGGLEKIGDRVSLKAPEAPLALNATTGGNLQLKIASNLETNATSELSLKTPQAPIVFNPDGALMLSIGSGLTIQADKLIVNAGNGLENTANQISLRSPLQPLELDAGQHNLKLNIGSGLENDNNQLVIKAPDAPLLLDPTTHNLKLNVSTGLQTVNNALAVKSPQPPLALDTTQNNLKLNYSTSDFTITNNELAILNKAPTLSFSAPLVQNGNTVSITTTEPITTRDNSLVLRWGDGIGKSGGKLVVNAQQPLYFPNKQLALRFGGGLVMDTANTLVINTQNPLGVDSNNKLIFNYNNKDFSIVHSALELNLQAGNGITIDRSGAQTTISVNSAVTQEQIVWGTLSNAPLTNTYKQSTYNLYVTFYRVGPMVLMTMSASCTGSTEHYQVKIYFQNTDFQVSNAYITKGTLKLLNREGNTLPDDQSISSLMMPKMTVATDPNLNELYLAGVKPGGIKRKWEYDSGTQKFILTLDFPNTMTRPFNVSFTDSWYGKTN